MEATHPHTSSNDMTNVLTGILIATGLAFRLTIVNPHQLYDALFKILSLVPVFMAIVINYPKFTQRLNTFKATFRRKKHSKKRANK
jgi:hypothetical protein